MKFHSDDDSTNNYLPCVSTTSRKYPLGWYQRLWCAEDVSGAIGMPLVEDDNQA
jgi:hypothetical protein